MKNTKMIVSIRDVKTQEYLGLVQVKNVPEAIRQFVGLCLDPRSPMYRFPRDYQVHHLGSFDVDTGKITPLELVADLTPYTHIDELVTKRERAELADYKSSEAMRESVDYFKNLK